MFGYFKNTIDINFFDELKFSIGQSHMRQIRSSYGNIKSLYDADYKVFSQYGEDGIIDYLMVSLSIDKPKFIEIGTQDYSESNTRFLYQDRTSFGVIVDSDTKIIEKSKRTLGAYYYKGEIQPVSLFIDRDNILDVYEKALFYGALDLFSLDIDGIDYWVISVLPKNFAKVAVVEFNPYFGDKLNITVPYRKNFDRTKFHHSGLAFGASLRAMINLMSQKGMIFVGTNLNNHNAFFLGEDYVRLLSLKLPTVQNLEKFTENYSRESRNEKGELTFANGLSRLNEIRDVDVINLNIGLDEKVKLSSLLDF
jgi:hypothetical protein